MGLTIVPSLYAWFNIAASWDPYGNTGNLKVAVANMDAGYRGSLFPMTLNVGDQVEMNLHHNTQLDWVFTDEDAAIRGVQEGTCLLYTSDPLHAGSPVQRSNQIGNKDQAETSSKMQLSQVMKSNGFFKPV